MIVLLLSYGVMGSQIPSENGHEYLGHVLKNLDTDFKLGGLSSVCFLKNCDQMPKSYLILSLCFSMFSVIRH